MSGDLIFLAVIALAIAAGLILQWRDRQQARRDLHDRVARIITGRREQ